MVKTLLPKRNAAVQIWNSDFGNLHDHFRLKCSIEINWLIGDNTFSFCMN